jgi:hypothetical protein
MLESVVKEANPTFREAGLRETPRRKQGPDFGFSGGIAFYKLDDVWEFQVVTGEAPNTVSRRSDQR